MSDSTKVSPETAAKWAHLEAKSVKALRAGWSLGAVARAYDVPYRIIRHWREEHAIPASPVGGRGRPMPAVGEDLA